jgi:hypothetical protein
LPQISELQMTDLNMSAGQNSTVAVASLEEVHLFLLHPHVINAIFIVLGLLTLLCGARRYPRMPLGAIASLCAGLGVGLLLQGWQASGTFAGSIYQGIWFPIVGIVAASALFALFVRLVWKAALALTDGALLVLLVLAACRLSHDDSSADQPLWLYRVGAGVVLLISLAASALLVRRCPDNALVLAVVHLGTLLVITGTSHFAKVLFMSDGEPTTLLDNLVHSLVDVFNKDCGLLPGCDCNRWCEAEISSWFACSWLLLFAAVARKRRSEAREQTEKVAGVESRAGVQERQAVSPTGSTASEFHV